MYLTYSSLSFLCLFSPAAFYILKMAGSASSSVWVFLIFVKCCNSLPLETPTISINPSNGPDAVYVGYVSDPEERGTASLVISCVMTVFLCAWFSLHLNLPQRLDSVYNALLRTLKWIIAIVYAPEVVVFTAWTQWNSARILKDIVKAQQEKSQEGSESQKFAAGPQNEWTMAHTFFASAGGFVFEIDHSGEEKNADNFLPADCPRRLTITARGIALLARCGRLPDISKADVTDKSKVNNIASALVIMQALWILTEVIGRLAVGLPVTLLEVNTVAHLYVPSATSVHEVKLTLATEHVPSSYTPYGGTSRFLRESRLSSKATG